MYRQVFFCLREFVLLCWLHLTSVSTDASSVSELQESTSRCGITDWADLSSSKPLEDSEARGHCVQRVQSMMRRSDASLLCYFRQHT